MTAAEQDPCFGNTIGLESCLATEANPAVLSHLGRVCVGCLLYDRDTICQQNTELQASNEKLQREATTDPLTRLSNRTAFEQALKEQMSRQQPFGLLFIDLANFGEVNTRLSHDKGDYMLILTASYLEDQLREGDALLADVSRYGGDEFCVVLSNEVDEQGQRENELTLTERVDAVASRLATNYQKVEDVVRYNRQRPGQAELGMHIKSAIWRPGMTRQHLMLLADPKRQGQLPLEFRDETSEDS